jgi:hypothetical protein
MKFPNFFKPFEVQTNANGFAIKRMLMEDGHPNSCHEIH